MQGLAEVIATIYAEVVATSNSGHGFISLAGEHICSACTYECSSYFVGMLIIAGCRSAPFVPPIPQDPLTRCTR